MNITKANHCIEFLFLYYFFGHWQVEHSLGICMELQDRMTRSQPFLTVCT